MRIKRILALLLSIVMLLSTTALPAFAETVEDWPFSYYSRSDVEKVADHLYEVEYDYWNPQKAEVIGHCLAKPELVLEAEKIALSPEKIQIVIDVLNEYFNVLESKAQELIDYITNDHSSQEYMFYISDFIEDHITDPSALNIFEQLYGDEKTGDIEITPKEFVSFLINLNELGKLYTENPLKFWSDLLNDIYELSPYACTSCRTGELIGRNFDWGYDDVDEYIMRVPADEGRYASIGVASGFFPPEIQDWIKINDILPMLTMDGINEKGVAINVNVVASSDLPTLLGVKGYKLAYTSGTNPGNDPFDYSNDVCAGFVVREILDHAGSAEEAIEILTQDKNVYSIITQEFHWMISDDNATYIVECVNNQLVVLKAEEAAMSNFHVTNSPHSDEYEVVFGDGVSDDYTKLPLGIERYKIVKNGLDGVVDEETMLANMGEVWYKEKLYGERNTEFWSDMNMHIWKDNSGVSHVFTYGDEDIKGAIAAREAAFEEYVKVKLPAALEREKKDPEHRRQRLGEDFNGVIQTVHTSVYNLDELTLTVNVQERRTSFCFALDDDVNANRTGITVNGDNVGIGVECEEAGQEWIYDRDTKVLSLLNCGENAYKLEGEDPEVTIVKAEHQWNDEFTIDVEPTADKAGSKSIHCLVCDARKDVTEIPATGKNKNNATTGIDSSNDGSSWIPVVLIVIALLGISGVVVYRIKKNR